jgi:hypothetical protein
MNRILSGNDGISVLLQKFLRPFSLISHPEKKALKQLAHHRLNLPKLQYKNKLVD